MIVAALNLFPGLQRFLCIPRWKSNIFPPTNPLIAHCIPRINGGLRLFHMTEPAHTSCSIRLECRRWNWTGRFVFPQAAWTAATYGAPGVAWPGFAALANARIARVTAFWKRKISISWIATRRGLTLRSSSLVCRSDIFILCAPAVQRSRGNRA